jgi:hypothetical protein
MVFRNTSSTTASAPSEPPPPPHLRRLFMRRCGGAVYPLMSLVHCLWGGMEEGVSITLLGKEGGDHTAPSETASTGCVDSS